MRVIEIRITERPPCEFASLEDLKNHTSTLPQQTSDNDWAKVKKAFLDSAPQKPARKARP